MKLYILLLFASTARLQDTLKGFHFKDNKSKYRWEDGRNGMAQLSLDHFLPQSLTVCMRGRIHYNRHGDHSYWFNVIVTKKKPRVGTLPMDFAFLQKANGMWRLHSFSTTPYIEILMNKEEQKKAEEARRQREDAPRQQQNQQTAAMMAIFAKITEKF